MPSNWHLLGRSLAIFAITIFCGTFISAFFLSLSGPQGFLGFFFVGLLMTSVMSVPNIFLLALGLWVVYKFSSNEKELWAYMIILTILLCLLPLAIFYLVFLRGVHGEISLLLMALPYAIVAFLSVLGSHYFRPLPLMGKEANEGGMDDVLDDGMF